MKAKTVKRCLLMALLSLAGLSITHTNPRPSVLNKLVRTSVHTANYVITEGESGTHFTNVGAGAVVVFTLPALKDGFECWIHTAVLAQDVVLSSPDVDTLVVFNDIAADQIAFNTTNEKAGGVFHVVCDGALWHVGESIHDGQTTVIAT